MERRKQRFADEEARRKIEEEAQRKIDENIESQMKSQKEKERLKATERVIFIDLDPNSDDHNIIPNPEDPV